jgi:hypothetical protein
MHSLAPDVIEGASAMQSPLASRNFSNLFQVTLRWGGWGSNPRPADYEKYGFVHCARHLHGYHGAVPPMALSALVAQMARSTNRSTASAPDLLLLLLCVTSLAAPRPMSGAWARPGT